MIIKNWRVFSFYLFLYHINDIFALSFFSPGVRLPRHHRVRRAQLCVRVGRAALRRRPVQAGRARARRVLRHADDQQGGVGVRGEGDEAVGMYWCVVLV